MGSQTSGGTNCFGAAQGLSYDCNGNLTFDGVFTYSYDAENRLLTASKTGVAAAYAYDPIGRRTQKSGTGVTAAFYLGDGTDEIAEYTAAGALAVRYIPGPAVDEPIAMVTSGGTKTYFHTNHQGSVVAMSGAGPTLTEGPYTYDPYGNCFSGAASCSGGEPYRFTGQRFDPETGLHYYRARYYSAALGRFLQTDPVGYTADLNLYTYGGNDPTDKTDPSGDCAEDGCVAEGIVAATIISAGIGAVVGVATQGLIDLSDGHLSSRSTYVGAGVGGAAGGATFALSGGNGVAAGAVSGGVSTTVQRTIDTNGHLTMSDAAVIAKDTFVGAGLGKFARFVSASGPGAAGTNAIARNEKMANMILGKVLKGQVTNMKPTTAAKIAVGVTTAAAPATVMEHKVETMAKCPSSSAHQFCSP